MSRVVGVYLTQSGKDGARIREDIGRDSVPRYSWTGAWGAGSGFSFDGMSSILNRLLRVHPRHVVHQEFWSAVQEAKRDGARKAAGALYQYDALYRRMAAGGRWNLHASSAGYVLLVEGASVDGVPLPIAVANVQAMSRTRLAAIIEADAQTREFTS